MGITVANVVLPSPWRSVEENMPEWLATFPGGVDGDLSAVRSRRVARPSRPFSAEDAASCQLPWANRCQSVDRVRRIGVGLDFAVLVNCFACHKLEHSVLAFPFPLDLAYRFPASTHTSDESIQTTPCHHFTLKSLTPTGTVSLKWLTTSRCRFAMRKVAG